jgi:putative intracellular protease/amidase
MALLSTLPETEKYNKELVAGHWPALAKLAHDFPYAGYKIAVFSKAEEKMIEGPQLGGPAPYYNDEALAAAGLKVENNTPWQPKVVQDRELITGQQPFSDHAFADALIAKLAAARR